MEKNMKLKMLESIGKVYEAAENCKLEDRFFAGIDPELELLSQYFGTTKHQSFFIAMVFALNYKGDTVDLRDMIGYFDCNPMEILKYNSDLSHLCATGIFEKQKSRHSMRVAGSSDQFTINGRVAEALLHNQPMPKLTEDIVEDLFGLLEKFEDLGEMRSDEEISTRELLNNTKALIATNHQYPLIGRINSMKLETQDAYLYLLLIWKAITGYDSVEAKRLFGLLYDNAPARIRNMQALLSGANILVEQGMIEIVEGRFLNEAELKLTDTSLNLMKECNINLFVKKKKNELVLSPTAIPARTLVFPETEMQQLFLLKDLLTDEKYLKTRQRLNDKHLPCGVTALLHGAPGTGKTEIVKQMARETQRELMKVEISQSKSAWFGESEKIVKRIFTDYKALAKSCERMPILLFNEADAIISKRRELGNSSVAQTENAIQNILLEELENFDGILIATTNLASNLDTAFERRFLFKIQFGKPDHAIRSRIWKLKMPSLPPEECDMLAQKFEFSGGQIDNIVRKSEIHEIVHGEKVTTAHLLQFCSEETMALNRSKIGFGQPISPS